MHIILNYLEPNISFSKMRIVSQYAAIELWGENSEELEQVHNAWFAVGVADRTPIENVEEKLLNVYVTDGNMVVETEVGDTIEVYSVVGQHLVSVEAQSDYTIIPLDSSVVIVKVGNTVQKVIIK